jgi:thiosulfate reductase cytochrome b subunit
MTYAGARSNNRRRARLHPLALRVVHWTNAIAMIIMIMSGWTIYNDEVIFGWLHFPDWMTMGAGPEGALQWHFLAMWILVANGIAYLGYGLSTGRFRRMLLPIRLAELISETRAALALKLAHDDLTRYNAVQRLLYIGIIVVIILQVLSGLVIWKPVQFSELAYLFYSFQGARLLHFLGMVAIVGFLIVHVALAVIVPKTLIAMLTGGPVTPPDTPTDREQGLPPSAKYTS